MIMNGYSKRITVIHFGDIFKYPPVINLVYSLAQNNYDVILVCGDSDKRRYADIERAGIKVILIEDDEYNNILGQIYRRFVIGHKYKKALRANVEMGGIVWTTTDKTVRILSNSLNSYKHIMQLMELITWMPLFKKSRFFKFNIMKYAQKAHKVVVPEINRAYITRSQWRLTKLPVVLPNKPFSLGYSLPSKEELKCKNMMENERKKIILFLGVIRSDIKLEKYIATVRKLQDEYCLYIIGRISGHKKEKDDFFEMLKNNSFVKYLGSFNPPQHLQFLEFAHIGLLPYSIYGNDGVESPLNSLYCAPNKIYEYAGYGVPMIGSDVLGLIKPFDEYNIGVSCDSDNEESIQEALIKVERNYDVMKKNCINFYNSIVLEDIARTIIED